MWVRTGDVELAAELVRGQDVDGVVVGAGDASRFAAAVAAPDVLLVVGEDSLVRRYASGEVVSSWMRCEGAHEAATVVEDAERSIASLRQSGELSAGRPHGIVLDCARETTWTIIPAENVIAAFGVGGADPMRVRVSATARTAGEARVLLEALEIGVDGVVMATDDRDEMASLSAWLRGRRAAAASRAAPAAAPPAAGSRMPVREATVTRVVEVGLGDRACIDATSLLEPGEGMLIGSFAQGLFLVHSECLETEYIESRPWRVNAGAVHQYVQVSPAATKYLSELRSGDECMVVGADGGTRMVTVGRVKIENRPMIMIEAEVEVAEGGGSHRVSAILQNAETVRLIQPGAAGSVPVTEIAVGDRVAVSVTRGARHTGLLVSESVFIER